MPAKPPACPETSPPRRGRRPRRRAALSGEMISPPLGDFRHSAHIGPAGAGDMFGELSFLQGRYDLLPGPGGWQAAAGAAGRCPPLLRSTVSLPVFGAAPAPAPPKPPRLHLEEPAGGLRGAGAASGTRGLCLAGLPCSVSFPGPPAQGPGSPERPPAPSSPLPRSESLLGFDLDLGPSILDDVLRIMDGYKLPAAEAL
ncbi:cdc42 effector protein 2-like [Dromaius novaehollandiae]|uniref:cdc42 effector protein 2-like n=1 Tax=Dromaius novaehollandiae TaxID=8790 RepID=UPI00311F6C6C